ncbi:ATP-dependent DNA ligase [Microbacterium laevaniformans]|uniref:ATP-dependent DNA ligase n=1 Tax=Microbacterium laevaniformans TaxID=36807 RepID=UPI001955F670|nr:ATP-dependent DNA ligase [Microbacterium laevaniformans]MBM7752794.1 bifunctional non-homologous end joining protein LigD [Microbacterium laevaniformans]GLJ64036.1 ATP-dependent DNA ligase [Microbacterium laevaniformans]
MAQSAQVVDVGGRRLRLTNLDKVLYPATGTTKAEVIDYYSRIAPVMLPHLAGRPVTRLRWPEGTGEAPFFAKDLEAGAPDWMPRHPIDHSGGAKDYPLVADVAGLVYLAQVASLELHTPQWRFDHGGRGYPDRLVLDLDPGPGVGLAECAEVARRARGILSDMGMEPSPVTSGSKGIHLYASLDTTRSSDEISAFARELARALEADDPDLVVSAMSKAARPGKVFVDWSQNNAAKTTIAPYSLRGRAQPTVAAPRTWAELDDPELHHLVLDEVLARVAVDGDLLAPLAPAAPDPLAEYVAKRTPSATPEPFPPSRHSSVEPPRSDAPNHGGSARTWRFVIQEHHASRLHWDLRLERDGVLVSWAVPRGIPDSPDRNHLAVMTEPHPIEYLTFAGEIPAGEYGAGAMTVWDSGTFTVEKWRDDEVIATLTGRPGGPLGRVRLALIRTSGAGEKSQWLLHRTKPAGKDAATGAVAAARAGQRMPSRSSRDSAAPMLAVSSTPALATSAARRWGGLPWVEFKWDGIRAVATWDGERMRLRARSGVDITERYPELTAADLGLGALPAVFDGEIVALDAAGHPSFTRLQSRMHLTGARDIAREATATPVHYFVFDLLRIGDDDIAERPLRERRELLESVTADAASPLVVPPVTDDIADALTAAADLRLEGVVVKDPQSPYRRGIRSERWLKVKLTATQEVVIGGIRPGKGERRGGIGSLLLGIPDAGGLRYVGRVGSGFTDRELARLESRLQPLRTDANPFVGVPAADAADALWLHPELVGEVEFAEFTPNGTLRHARWRGLRTDKQPMDVRREE